MTKLLRRLGPHRPDIEALSAHLDGRLDEREARAVDAHVATCGACREALQGLRDTRALLAGLADVEEPRSFRLTRAAVQAPASEPLRRSAPRSRGALRWAPALSGVAAAVFVVAVGIDAYSGPAADRDRASERTGMIVASDNGVADEQTSEYAGQAETQDREVVEPGDSAGGGEIPMPAVTGDAGDAAAGEATGPGAVEGTAAPETGDVPAAATAPDDGAAPPMPSGGAWAEAPGAPDAAAPTKTPAELLLFSSDEEDGGNLPWLRIVQIAAAATALVAGGAYAARGWIRRGDA